MRNILTGSVVTILCALGGGVALDAACSPSNPTPEDAGPTCDPDSGDPAGCACDPNKPSVDCYSGPPGTSSKGICKPGKRTCNNGKYTECVGEVTPKTETCNYTDDDCDGIVDDLPEIADAAVVSYCTSPACSPDYVDAAITCWGPDPGICGAGKKTCAGGPTGGSPTGCAEFIYGGAPEVCNGVDDDCNGAVDDGLDQEGACDMKPNTKWPDGSNPFDASADGAIINTIYGECIHGQLHCEDGGDKCYPSQPTTEALNYGEGCDGLDNDCDGIVDNHACTDSFDITYGNTYCCADSIGYCVSASEIQFYTGCKLANK